MRSVSGRGMRRDALRAQHQRTNSVSRRRSQPARKHQARAEDSQKVSEGRDGVQAWLAPVLSTALLCSPFWCFGSSMVTMKAALPHASPLLIATDRLLPAGAILLAFASWRGETVLPPSLDAWLRILAFAAIDGTAFQLFLTEGLQKTQAGLGSVIIDSQPLTVAVLAALLYGEKISAQSASGLLVGVFGLILLELPSEVASSVLSFDFTSAASSLKSLVSFQSEEGAAGLLQSGEFLMLLASQSMAVGTVLVPWVTRKAGPVTSTGWHLLLGALPLMAYSLATEPAAWQALPSTITLLDLFNLIYSTLLGGAAGYAIFFWYAQKGDVAKLSSLTFLTPMFAAATGYTFLGERLTLEQLAGAVVTLLGICLVNFAPSSSSSSSTERKEDL